MASLVSKKWVGRYEASLTVLAVFGLMGAARGLDEGLTGTTASLKSFSSTFVRLTLPIHLMSSQELTELLL